MTFPSKSHERLDVLSGIWDTTITMLDEAGQDGDVTRATDAYRWTGNGHFLLHDVDASLGGTAVQSVEVIAVDGASGCYSTRSYDADGGINDFTAALSDHDWTMIGNVQRFVGRFGDDWQTLTGQWEQRHYGHWSPLMKVSLRKRAGD